MQQDILLEKSKACMLLAAVGDAMGYKNGDWEFNTSSKLIHAEMMKMTNNEGPLNLRLGLDWRYSDDTVMHIATALALVSLPLTAAIQQFGQRLAVEYKICWSRMSGRAPGNTCGRSIRILQKDGSNWNKIPYSNNSGGCGASMRTACVGIMFMNDPAKLIAVSIEAGRETHHCPVGYLGGMISAYFTSLALKGISPKKWAAYLFSEGFPLSQKYIEDSQREVKLNLESGQWQKFVKAWKSYCKIRNVSMSLEEEKEPIFPEVYGVVEREHFYKELAWSGWPGALGIDSVLIAYDALLGSGESWEQMCLRGILHGGDNDSTGTIGGAWFGALYGLKGVPASHIKELQDHNKLSQLGEKLYKIIKK